ncbi:MAG: tetratricopeptide repeat protein, partial [Edaphocola sp.]
MSLSYPEAQKKSEELKSFAKKNNDISLELEAEIYLAYYCIFHHIGTENERIDRMLEVEERGKEEKILDIEARAVKVLQDYYWYDKKNYEIGFEYGLKLDKILSRTNAKDFPDLPEYYHIIGKCYYLFRDYPTAIKYFKKTLEVPENSFNWRSHWAAANTLGLCYRKLNKTDSSDYYLKQSLQSSFLTKDDIQYTISQGNIGFNLYQKGQFEEAETLFREDVSNAVKTQDYGLAAGSMIPLADIYIYQGKMKEAAELLKKSETYIRKSGQQERFEDFYPVISRWYERNGNKEMSVKYRDSAIIASNENNNTFNGLVILRVQQKIDRQKMEQDEKNRKIKTSLFFLFLAIISVFAVLYYFYQKKIYKEKNKTKEAELRLSQEKLETAKI